MDDGLRVADQCAAQPLGQRAKGDGVVSRHEYHGIDSLM
jgi:hypothetical protein